MTYPRTHTLAQVSAEAGTLPPDTSTGRRVSVAGRVILKRDHGQARLRDSCATAAVTSRSWSTSPTWAGELDDFWRHDIDLGDHIGVTGEVITTRLGELSVRAESLALTSKSLRPCRTSTRG